ncbi:hypothetical protein GQ53DRAFT_241215 [Thozetella sp. PMI_491]|nr:hypothetical protein GQ53DRAFT_241215 [Thozetella sp. PMI_491]
MNSILVQLSITVCKLMAPPILLISSMSYTNLPIMCSKYYGRGRCPVSELFEKRGEACTNGGSE